MDQSLKSKTRASNNLPPNGMMFRGQQSQVPTSSPFLMSQSNHNQLYPEGTLPHLHQYESISEYGSRKALIYGHGQQPVPSSRRRNDMDNNIRPGSIRKHTVLTDVKKDGSQNFGMNNSSSFQRMNQLGNGGRNQSNKIRNDDHGEEDEDDDEEDSNGAEENDQESSSNQNLEMLGKERMRTAAAIAYSMSRQQQQQPKPLLGSLSPLTGLSHNVLNGGNLSSPILDQPCQSINALKTTLSSSSSSGQPSGSSWSSNNGQQQLITETIYNGGGTMGTTMINSRLKGPQGIITTNNRPATLMRFTTGGSTMMNSKNADPSNPDSFYSLYASTNPGYIPNPQLLTHLNLRTHHHLSGRHPGSSGWSIVNSFCNLFDMVIFWKILSLIFFLLCLMLMSIIALTPSDCNCNCETIVDKLSSESTPNPIPTPNPCLYNDEHKIQYVHSTSTHWPLPQAPVVVPMTPSTTTTTAIPSVQPHSSNGKKLRKIPTPTTNVKCQNGIIDNGSCVCDRGWNGRLCGFQGCPNDCGGSDRGECTQVTSPGQVTSDSETTDSSYWQCQCLPGFTGLDCGQELEMSCNDGIDNDRDGLVDCADSECCTSSKECGSNPLCFSSADPLDVLLRKQPPSPTSSFFQRMKFLIEEDSVQSYAHKQTFNDSYTNQFKPSQASVIRGRVITSSGSGLMGVRVGVSSDPLLGFVVSRENGWFDIMVNGGGTVTLHFQREPFKPRERRLIVPWNEIVVTDDVLMSVPGQDVSPDKEADDTSIQVCPDHDYDRMDPEIEADWNANTPNDCTNDPNGLLSDAQVLSESLDIPNTGLSLIYNSSRASGYKSNVDITMTPSEVPSNLKYVHLKVSVEGILIKKIFEADSDLKYTFSWNRRNVYKQKVYKVANVIISVGYEYTTCGNIVWVTKSTGLPGHDMAISEIGGWNLNIHHRYNFIEGILQKGNGVNVYLNTIRSYLPSANENGDYEILSSDERELYIFNRHGLHIATKSLITNQFIYNFTYTVNTSFGKLTSVTTPSTSQHHNAGHDKITFLRDHLNQVKEIETSSGVKCRIEMSRTRMLEVFVTPSTTTSHLALKRTVFHYNGVTGLIKSKSDSSTGNTFNYDYDRNGRLIKAVGPDGNDLTCRING